LITFEKRVFEDFVTNEKHTNQRTNIWIDFGFRFSLDLKVKDKRNDNCLEFQELHHLIDSRYMI
jgi:hypothetical protein